MSGRDVFLSPMTEADYARFLDITTRDYAEENVQAGYWTAAEALERSRKDILRLLPDGVATTRHRLSVIVDRTSGKPIGHVWVRVEEGAGGKTGFIFALYLDKEHRGQGFGKAAMAAIDQEAQELGLRSMGLHVFAANQVAVHLYEVSGYNVRSLNMIKEY